ncbi:MAG TPA: type II toxin-antitoxin system VapC family toxin [Conexibacter sp.]
MIVIDTSALVAILREEPEGLAFEKRLALANDPLISAATLFECSTVQARFDQGLRDLDDFMLATGIRVAAVDVAQAHAARDAWLRYGKGRSPAGLNFGDCFSYALAKTTGRPLLFKGDDFAQTDVTPAAV